MRNLRSAISVLLSLVIVSATVFTVSVTNAFATDTGISYSFANDIAGYAQGTITVTPTSDNYGAYYLYWADDTKALDGYAEISILNISSGSGEYTMPEYTAIPADATKVIAIKSSTEPSVSDVTVADADAVFDIPASKQHSYSSEKMLYSFASIGDPQLANDSYGSGKYPYNETHWVAALETMADRKVDFAVSSGDTVNDQNGNQTYSAEYKRYQKILAESSYANPVYEANGNHEMWADPESIGVPAFIKGTGLDSVKDTITAGKPYFEITEPVTGDHFIFMALEGTFYTNQGTQFSTAQLDWLEGLLKKYDGDGKNIFIIEHGNIAGWGSGDKLTEPYYYDLGLNKNSADVARFINLMETYKECVIITAHTHLELGAQLNYSDNNGTSAVMIHNSAIGGVRRLVDGVVDREPVLGLSEGYIVEVYEDCILFNGINLYYNEIMPSCSYIVPFGTSEAKHVYGDLDLNGIISINDATRIQCHIADIIAIDSEQAKFQADVTGDGEIDINDATAIQKLLAKLIEEFPVETQLTENEDINVPPVTASLTETLTLVQDDLDAYYRFSSYDQYMALKKAYLEYKDATLTETEENTAVVQLTAKQEALYAIAGKKPSEMSEEITVYFTNSYNWSTVRAYVWGSAGVMVSWPGAKMTFEKTNSYGQDVYSITLNYEKYQKIIFTNGSKQTVDIDLTGEDNIGYYISGESSGKYTCKTYVFS